MEEPIVLKIFLIGFHHKKGCVKDSEYPKENKYDFDIERLPSLCLPDQSHNYESDSVYFVIPNSNEEKRIFGVSCFRQIKTDKLINRKENDGTEFSRSSVQKSVCCLTSIPLFGYIEVKLNLYVDKIFEQADFLKCEELLKESYIELNRCLSMRLETIDLNDFYIGLCLRELISIWKHKILVLFKLLLLEKRVLCYGTPVRPLCTTILSIISLHPHLLNKGLWNCPDKKQKKLEIFQDDKINVEEEITNSTDSQKPHLMNLRCINTKDFFAPMHIFKNGYLCLPFISLSYIDIIADKLNNGFIAGASNVLFQQKKNLVDVIIDIPTQTIDYNDAELKRSLQLTSHDLRFFEHILKGIDSPSEEMGGIGTDQWIRNQFESYFTSMLRTNYEVDNDRELECFNECFMEEWRKTNNYQDWLTKKITFMSSNLEGNDFDKFPLGHPFSRQPINVSDVRNKIVQSINNTPSARKTVAAVTTTFSNAKSSFALWLSNLSVKEEVSDDLKDEYDKVDEEKTNQVI
ncbi:hypothetical protein ACKWTF_002338 [Chironomus riparius]